MEQPTRKRRKILWLVSWYPNKYDPFDGDFVQRHARAAAVYDDIHVFFIKQAEEQNSVEKTWDGGDGLTEQIIYLPKKKGMVGKIKNYWEWQAVYKTQLSLLVQREQPDFVHVHVPWKAGLVAFWLKRRFKLPFLITEHWGIYNNVVDDNISTKSFLFRYLLRRIYQQSVGLATVSRYLGEQVNKTLVKTTFTVIANVVDTSLFFPTQEKHERFTFLHVSNMVALKNVTGILTAFKQFLEATGADAQLVLVGNKDADYPQLAQAMGLLNKTVFFRGEVSYDQVAREMQRAHVFVLNSDMENSPCVIGEALCCGLPVIATNVGGIPELIQPEQGTLIKPNDNTGLTAAFGHMHLRYSNFQLLQIANTAAQTFSAPVIGSKLHALYSAKSVVQNS